MPLINLQTNLKSLKYGQDRQDGGDSGQPYIKKDINKANPGIKFDDGLVRGGTVNAAVAGAVDTARVFKFLKDLPKGPLFIAKQVGLQLSNPRLEVKKSSDPVSGFLNRFNSNVGPTRIYNLGLNTLAQVPVNAFGIHFNRHGLLPIQNENTKYEAVVTANNDFRGSSKFNRLIELTTRFKLGDREYTSPIRNVSLPGGILAALPLPINLKPQDLIIDNYAAGPNSIYGIGRTTLNRYSNTEDGFKINLQTGLSRQFAGKTRNQNGQVEEVKLKNTKDYKVSTLTSSSLSSKSWIYNNNDLNNSFLNPIAKSSDTGSRSQPIGYTSSMGNDLGTGSGSISQYPGSKDEPTAFNENVIEYSNPSLKKYAELQKQVSKTSGSSIYSHTSYVQDKITGNISNLDSGYKYSQNTNFTILKKDSRVIIDEYGLHDGVFPSSSLEEHIIKTPQSKVNNIKKSAIINFGSNIQKAIAPGFPGTQQPDRIADQKKQKKYINLFDRTNDTLIGDDTMKIVFTPIHPFTGKGIPIDFLGYLKNYDESYDSTWGDVQYVGRAEKFYIFNSFKRTANISFIVPAFQPGDIVDNHKKLFDLGKKSLAYALAGQYNENALLGGVIIGATVGNYLNNTPGIITNLKFDIVENSPWDLNIKYAQYLSITVGFTIIGDKLPIYEDIVFTVQQTDTEPLPEEEDEERREDGALDNINVIPQAFKDKANNTSQQQRYVEQTLKQIQKPPIRPTTATGQPNQIQPALEVNQGQTAVLSDVLRGR